MPPSHGGKTQGNPRLKSKPMTIRVEGKYGAGGPKYCQREGYNAVKVTINRIDVGMASPDIACPSGDMTKTTIEASDPGFGAIISRCDLMFGGDVYPPRDGSPFPVKAACRTWSLWRAEP